MTATATTPVALPRRYDFDEVYSPLPRLDQNGRPSCIKETRATIINAVERMRFDRTTRHDDRTAGGNWSPDPDDPACSYRVDLAAHRLRVNNLSGCRDGAYWPAGHANGAGLPIDTIKRAIYLNGVLECGVPAYSKPFANAYRVGRRGHWRMPVLEPVPKGPSAVDHGITAVGFTPRGIIVLNSWPDWGYRQRAILSPEFITHYGVTFAVHTFEVIGGPAWPADSRPLR